MAYSTVRSTTKAYQKGLTTRIKPGLSAEDIAKRKAELNKEIRLILTERSRYQTEVVEQYGGVAATVANRQNDAITAYMGAFAEVKSAAVRARADALAPTFSASAKAFAETKYGNQEIMKSVDTFQKATGELETNDAYLLAGAYPTKELALEAYINGNTKNIENMLKQIPSNKVGLDPVQEVAYTAGVRNVLTNKIIEDLTVANVNGTLISIPEAQELAGRILEGKSELQVDPKTEALALQKMNNVYKDYQEQVNIARNLGVDVSGLEKFIGGPDPLKDYGIKDFAKDFAGIPVDPDLEDELTSLRQQRKDLDKPQLTAYGQFEKDYLAHPEEKYLTDLLGFRDPTEAAFLYGSNPNALETALRTAEEAKGMITSSAAGMGDFEVTGMDAARLEVAKQLGIVDQGRERRITPARLRMAMIRNRPVGQPLKPSAPAPAEPAAKDQAQVKPAQDQVQVQRVKQLEEGLKNIETEAGKTAVKQAMSEMSDEEKTLALTGAMSFISKLKTGEKNPMSDFSDFLGSPLLDQAETRFTTTTASPEMDQRFLERIYPDTPARQIVFVPASNKDANFLTFQNLDNGDTYKIPREALPDDVYQIVDQFSNNSISSREVFMKALNHPKSQTIVKDQAASQKPPSVPADSIETAGEKKFIPPPPVGIPDDVMRAASDDPFVDEELPSPPVSTDTPLPVVNPFARQEDLAKRVNAKGVKKKSTGASDFDISRREVMLDGKTYILKDE
jgi:hypothetical protein